MTVYRKNATQVTVALNTEIIKKYLANQNKPDIRKTHLFGGRYENIYLTEKHISALTPLIDEAIKLASDILDIKNLRAGYWFNYMPPGSTTTVHSHDDYDELLSAVYYLSVPKNSGNLIVHHCTQSNHEEIIEIIPHVGEFIFFKPDIRHEVTKNESTEHRLSIGINFGPSN